MFKSFSKPGINLLAQLCCIVLFTSAMSRPGDVSGPKLDDLVTLTGYITDDLGVPLENFALSVNETTNVKGKNGHYTVTTPHSNLYTLHLSSPNHYRIIHNFSATELPPANSETVTTFTVPHIALTQKKPGRTMMAFGGDVMFGRRYYDPLPGNETLVHPGSEEVDIKAVMAHIKPYLELADYASVNLESILIDREPKEAMPKSVTFYSHPDTLKALAWAGVDFVSLGNNHTYDYGAEGIEETLSALNRSSIDWSGAGLTETDALRAHRITLNDEPWSFLGYVGWQGRVTPNQVAEGPRSGTPGKGGAAWGSDDNIQMTVTREARTGSATVVQYHGSREYSDTPSDSSETRLKSAIDHGADLVIAHHPHVPQGFEIYKDKLIAWSMGNFAFDQYRYQTFSTVMLYVWMDGETFHRAEIVPVYVKNYHPTPAVGTLRENIMHRINVLSANRGTLISKSGGHGIITVSRASARNTPAPAHRTTIDVQLSGESPAIAALPSSWTAAPVTLRSDGPKLHAQFGRNILPFGDFEQNGLFELSDETWSTPNGKAPLTTTATRSGQYSVELILARNRPKTLTLTEFLRDYKGEQVTLKGYAKTDIPVTVKVFTKLWKREKYSVPSFLRARANGPHNIEETLTLPASNTAHIWTPFSVTFDVPSREDYRGFMVGISLLQTQSSQVIVHLDDLAIIDWRGKEITVTKNPQPMTQSGYNDHIRIVGTP